MDPHGTLLRDGAEQRFSRWIADVEARLDGAGTAGLERRLAYLLGELVVRSPIQAMAFLREHPGDGVRAVPGLSELVARLAGRLLDDGITSAVEELAQWAAEWGVPLNGTILAELARAHARTGEPGRAHRILEETLKREPSNADALRKLYRLARQEGWHVQAHDLLNRLVAADPSLSTVTYAFRERKALAPTPGRAARIAVLSSYVLDQLIPYVDAECRRVGLAPEFHVSPYNQYSQEVLDPSSTLYAFRPEIVFLALAIEDLFPAISACPTTNDLKAAAQEIRRHVLGLVEMLEERSGGVVVVHEFSLSHRSPHGILDNRLSNGLAPWIGALNQSLAEELRARGRAFLLPLNDVLGWVGKARSQNPKLRYMASMRIGDAALPELSACYMRYLKPLTGLTRKCVVVDLDGTLWGGVVGEVGLEGVALGPTAPGVEYMEFQESLLNLTRRGILLAVCSKNNSEDALAVIRNHKYMLLREEHFGAVRINWRNKAENLREIAEELNVGLDSMVFLDDNPVERELIRQLLPEVLTPELPRDPSRYRVILEEMSDFELLAVTREDEIRTVQYQAMAKRRAIRDTARSLDEYLASLEIEIEVKPASPTALNRLMQMFGKTNQFNLTTRRYQAAEIDRFMRSDDHVVYVLQVRDRFGDHGLVGVAVIEKEDGSWRIDSLLMSCRVMGLSIETAFLARVYRDACAAGAVTLSGEFIRTSKNQPVDGFYECHGFRLVRDAAGHQLWERELGSGPPIETPAWIAVRGVATAHAS